MGEQDEDQGMVARRTGAPLTAARARAMTAGLREAMDDVRRSVAVLAARVRARLRPAAAGPARRLQPFR
ncbi:hypothetical protein V2J94_38025 [Streptomyces sp. DSM 41524]|uniref:Uncharacterized protein n=1 Tax=Streptomyces asiaticus subsp. ignotus TaxID=3098222 RepID=A0ABU7Q8C3_9ACTN|nr:hypothetical protein [Streptomyces sp. DSM 41524]